MMILQRGVYGRRAIQKRFLSTLQETLKCNVGGQKYTLFRDDIQKYPGSYFERALSTSNSANIEIARDGVLFKYVCAFLVSGRLPRNGYGICDVDQKTLSLLKPEADFYNLDSLRLECEKCATQAVESVSPSKDQSAKKPVSIVDFGAPVVHSLSKVWRPVVTQGKLKNRWTQYKLFRDSSVDDVKVSDLIAATKKISTNDSGPYVIDAVLLSDSALRELERKIDITNLFPDQEMTLKARRLVIRTPECAVNQSEDLNATEERVGTVEVLLNSVFTGGELHVTCNGQATTLKAVPEQYVAMLADTSYSIGPVTSGTRVSLIYDIIPVTKLDAKKLVQHGQLTSYSKKLVNDVNVGDFDMDKLLDMAQHLQPKASGSRGIGHLDPYFLNEGTLDLLPAGIDLSGLFPHKKLRFLPKDVTIHDTSSRIHKEACDQGGEGYLGTLVTVVGSYFTGGKVCISRAQESTTFDSSRMSWYAYAAGSTHHVGPISFDTRVAVHFDIFSAGDVDKVHDPLAGTSQVAVYRTILPVTMQEEVLAAVNAELSTVNSVIITLQDVYSDHVEPATLTGGDQAFFDLLSQKANGLYSTELVKVDLQFKYDRAERKDVLKSGTFTSTVGNESSFQHLHELVNKLVVPTKLSASHRVSTDKHTDQRYRVTGLRVTKRK